MQIWDLLITSILRGGMYSLMAMGLAIIMGVMNVSSFMHGEIYMIGAYIGWIASVIFQWNPILSIGFAAVGSFVIGILIEKGFFWTLRRRSKEEWLWNAYLITVGLSFVLQNAALAVFGGIYRGVPGYWEGKIQLSPTIAVSIDRFAAFMISVVTIAAFWFLLMKTELGRAIRAVSQDEHGALLVGIDLDQVYTLTFGLSSMLAGIAGAALLSMIPAYPTMGASPLAKSWFVVILAGLGNVRGAIAGGLIVGVLETVSYYFFGSGWQSVITAAILILILLLKPSGIFGSQIKGSLER